MAGPFKVESKSYTIKLPRVPGTDPMNPDAINNRGVEYYRQEKFDQALLDFNKAIEMKPKYVAALYNRGLVYYRKSKYDRAISDCSQALTIDPQCAKAYNVRGLAYAATKRYQFAISDLRTAIEIGQWSLGEKYQDILWAMNHLAWMQATCPEVELRDGKKAAELATQACELTDWKNTWFIDTLAAAYAETGDFDSAVKWQKKAIALAEEKNQTTDVKKFNDRLKLYELGKPFHESQ